jgi:hypothetical protein
MSEGGGQAVVFTLPAYPNFKLYHYDDSGGSTTLKNIYSDEALTSTMAQPAVADANGVIQFYGHGDYRFLIKDSSDVERYDWDPYHVSQGQSVILNYDTSFGTANAANKGMLKGKIDGSSVVRGLGMSNGSAWTSIAEFDSSGNQSISTLISKSMPVYNVLHADWGAIGDGSNDDTAAIQAAIAAIQTAGSGILYLPAGTYKISSALAVTNTPIWIQGDGSGQTIILQTGGDGTNGLTISQSSVSNQVILSDFTMRTSVANTSGQAIDINWTAGTTLVSNFILRDVVLDPETAADDHWFEGLVLDDVHAANINGLIFQGKNDDRTASVGLEIQTASGNINIDNCSFQNMITGIKFIDTAANTSIDGASIINATDGVEYFHQSATGRHFLQNSMIETHTTGVKLTKTVRLLISNNIMFKISTSTQAYTGISLTDTNDIINISRNLIEDAASSGTFTGIDLISGTGVDMDGNQIYCGSSTTPEGIQVAAGMTDFNIRDNRIKDAITGIEILAGASDYYVIANNNFEGCTTGISDGGTGTNVMVDGNIPVISGTVASAGTITLPSQSNYISLTGVITVDNITVSWSGRIITLRSSSSPTIRHNIGNIQLAGAASYVMTALDTLTLISDGTDWHEVGRAVI